jgi:hypothetical protein
MISGLGVHWISFQYMKNSGKCNRSHFYTTQDKNCSRRSERRDAGLFFYAIAQSLDAKLCILCQTTSLIPLPSHLPCIPSHPPHPSQPPTQLIRPSSLLTSLQLIQIPATDAHIPLILIHTAREILDVRRAGLVLRSAITARSGLVLAVVEIVVHGLRVGVRGVLLGGLFLGGGAAAEEAADGVADRGSYCDTAVCIERLALLLS